MRGRKGTKRERREGAFPPLSLFCLVRFAAQHDIAERTHEWSEGGRMVCRTRSDGGGLLLAIGRRGGPWPAALASLQLATRTNIPRFSSELQGVYSFVLTARSFFMTCYVSVGPCILLIRTGPTAVKTPLRNFYEVDIYPTALFSKTALRSR